MTDIAETFIVVSLLMAVFAAVSAVGTALVLGVGFERLRGSFEIVRKQTAYFSDALRKLDDQTAGISERTAVLENQTAVLNHKTATLEAHQNDMARELRDNAHNHIHAGSRADLGEIRDPAADALMREVSGMARKMRERRSKILDSASRSANTNEFIVPASLMEHVMSGSEEIRFH
jgi:hypothetical protein